MLYFCFLTPPSFLLNPPTDIYLEFMSLPERIGSPGMLNPFLGCVAHMCPPHKLCLQI